MVLLRNALKVNMILPCRGERELSPRGLFQSRAIACYQPVSTELQQ